MEETLTEEEAKEYREKAATAIWNDETPPRDKEDTGDESASSLKDEENLAGTDTGDEVDGADEADTDLDEPKDVVDIGAEIAAAQEKIWEGVNLKLEERFGQLDSQLKETVGRVGAIQSKLDKQPSKKELAAASTDEKWENLKDEYPDWAEAIDARIAEEHVEMPDVASLTEGFVTEETVQEQIQAAIQKETAETNFRLVSLFHPNCREKVKTKTFKTWLAGQEDDVQAKLYSDDPIEVIDLLNQYKSKTSQKTAAEIKAERQAALDKAARAEKGTQTKTRPKAVADMTLEEYREKKAAEIWKT